MLGAACQPTRTPLDLAVKMPNAPLSVEERKTGPRLATVSREGDPSGAVAMAIVSPRAGLDGGAASRTIAALVDARLRARSVEPATSWDGAGVRVALSLSDSLDVQRAVELLRDALHRPVALDDVNAVRRSLESSAGTMLAAPYAPLARCTGEPASVPGEGFALETQSLDELLAKARRRGGVALGAVGTSERTGSLARAVDDGETWSLEEQPQARRPLVATHSVTVAGRPSNEPQLDVAVPLRDPRRALQLALQEEVGRSPLSVRLVLSESPFRLARVVASAQGDGGCVRLTLEAKGVTRSRLPRAAAEALAVASETLKTDLETPLEPTVVARQILRSTDAAATAELAAWWALAGAAAEEVELETSSVLAVPAERGDIAGTYEELEGAYRSEIALATQRSPSRDAASPKPDERVAVERGQGESWLLIANECALAREGDWDAGRSALVARIAASPGTLAGVVLEPWVEPAGVGLLARTQQLPGETSAATGRRLGMVVGVALTSLATPEERFARTKLEALRLLSTPSARRLEGLLTRLEGAAPSWLRPDGLLERQLATTAEDAEERWRAMLREPWRVAMIAAHDVDESPAAFGELRRWVGPPDDAGCQAAHSNRTTAPAAARWAAPSLSPHAFLAFQAEGPSESAVAEVVVAHLASVSQRVAAESRAVLVGAPRRPTVVVEIVASGAERDAALGAWHRELESLRTGALSEDELRKAQLLVNREHVRALESPRGRISALWRGDRVTPVSHSEVREWLGRHLTKDRIQVLTGDPELP